MFYFLIFTCTYLRPARHKWYLHIFTYVYKYTYMNNVFIRKSQFFKNGSGGANLASKSSFTSLGPYIGFWFYVNIPRKFFLAADPVSFFLGHDLHPMHDFLQNSCKNHDFSLKNHDHPHPNLISKSSVHLYENLFCQDFKLISWRFFWGTRYPRSRLGVASESNFTFWVRVKKHP